MIVLLQPLWGNMEEKELFFVLDVRFVPFLSYCGYTIVTEKTNDS